MRSVASAVAAGTRSRPAARRRRPRMTAAADMGLAGASRREIGVGNANENMAGRTDSPRCARVVAAAAIAAMAGSVAGRLAVASRIRAGLTGRQQDHQHRRTDQTLDPSERHHSSPRPSGRRSAPRPDGRPSQSGRMNSAGGEVSRRRDRIRRGSAWSSAAPSPGPRRAHPPGSPPPPRRSAACKGGDAPRRDPWPGE